MPKENATIVRGAELCTKTLLIEIWGDSKMNDFSCCPNCRDNLTECDKDGKTYSDCPYDYDTMDKYLTCGNHMCLNSNVYERSSISLSSVRIRR